MSPTKDTWTISAGLLQFPGTRRDGTRLQDGSPELWFDDLVEVASVGFTTAEVGDGWLRAGDLSDSQLTLLSDAASQAGVGLSSVAVIRTSIIDPVNAAENLAYSHRAIDAAAALGSRVVSFGLHRELTPEQRQQLWFWTVDGASDDPADRDSWNLAVAGFRELGDHAASLGLEVSLEMYEDTYLGTADSAVRLITDIGLDNVGLNPDLGNLIRLHRPVESWEELVEKTVPYANYWHIKNYFRDEDAAAGTYFATPAPLELGVVNYRWAIKEALRAGFTGAFVCEHYGGDGLGVSARNREYIRSLLPTGGPVPQYMSPATATARTKETS